MDMIVSRTGEWIDRDQSVDLYSLRLSPSQSQSRHTLFAHNAKEDDCNVAL